MPIPFSAIRWIQLGLLISLLSKPLVAMMLPVLFVLPETRRKLLLPVAVYAALSLLFLLLPRLNPGGYNGTHWFYIPNASFKAKVAMTLLNPVESDLADCRTIYSLPMLLNAGGAGRIVLLLAKLPVAAAVLLSLAPLVLPQRGQRIRVAIVTAALCTLAYNLSYFQGWEYHYTTLLPLLPAMLWLWRGESSPPLRRLLMGCFLASLPLFLPTPFFLAPEDPNLWALSALERVAPVIVAFYGLLIYGVASTWLARRQPRSVAPQTVCGLRATLCLGGLMGLLLGAVATTVYATVPARLRIATKNWSPRDWETHLEDVISRPGVAPEVLAGIHKDLGQLYAAAEPRTALEHYRKAAAFPSPSAQFHADLGDAFLAIGQFDEAIQQCQRALELDPGRVDVHNNLGAALVGRGRIDEAMAHFQRVLEITPDDAEAHNDLGFALAARGRMDEAMAHFVRALIIKPGHVLAHNNLGLALAGRGRIDEAIAQYRQALEIKPDYAEAHVNLGMALTVRGRIDQAIGHYQQALKIKPDYAEAHVHLGMALMAHGRVDEAIEQYQRALKIKPDHAEAHVNLGIALAGSGRIDEAMAHFQRALEIKPDYAEAHIDLGTALANRGRMDEATAHFQKALEIKPDHAEAHINLGIALAGSGRMDEAMAHFQRALEIKPDYAEAHKNLGIALAGAGRLDEAIGHYQKALVLARQQNKAALVEELKARLQACEAGTPHSQP